MSLIWLQLYFPKIKIKADLLKSLRHPNIVAYKDSFMIDGTLIIIMEYCEGNTLFSLNLAAASNIFRSTWKLAMESKNQVYIKIINKRGWHSFPHQA